MNKALYLPSVLPESRDPTRTEAHIFFTPTEKDGFVSMQPIGIIV